ncbi:MAG: acetylxylan esterase [Terracidiphilus sp.]
MHQLRFMQLSWAFHNLSRWTIRSRKFVARLFTTEAAVRLLRSANLHRLLLALVCLSAVALSAQSFPAGYNRDEAKVAPYTLLDPLTFPDGRHVTKASWPQRRAEIVTLFEENVFGRTPSSAQHLPLRAHIDEQDDHALNGRAIRKQITLYFSPQLEAGPKEHLLLYLPIHHRGPAPVILGLNFFGNHTVLADPAIRLNPVWSRRSKSIEPPSLVAPDESTRGKQAEEWQVEKVLARGYGLATVYYGDIDPDFKDSIQLGIRPFFYAPGQTTPAPNDWGAIGVWAWGLSRALDYLVTDPLVDPHDIAVTGHSRLGKAADWAAAEDTRFSAVLSTESGKGGQSLYRRTFGENIAHLEHSFPYWFCANYARWVDRDTQIPVDGNLLLSLIAPRPVYVASAEGDLWSDPRGEFLSAVSVSRVYRLLDKSGLDVATMPAVNQPTDPARSVAYHVRSGIHDVTAFDWDQYLNFLDAHFGRQFTQ